MLLQIIGAGYAIGEITCPTRYMDDSSSISALRSIKYGIGILIATIEYKFAKFGFIKSNRYN